MLAGMGGLLCLGALLAVRWLGQTMVGPSGPESLAFLAAAALALVGCATAAGAFVRVLAVRIDPNRATAWLVGWRQLAHDATGVVQQAITLTTLASVFLLGGAVTLITQEVDANDPRSDQWVVSADGLTTEQALGTAAVVGTSPILIRQSATQDHVLGTCRALRRSFGNVVESSGRACRPGQKYPTHALVVNDGGTTTPVGLFANASSVETVDPTAASAGALRTGAETSSYALIGDVADIDAMQTAALAIAPGAQFSRTVGSAETYLIGPRISRLVLAATGFGLLAVVAALLLSLSGAGFIAQATVRYATLGASRAGLRRIAATRTGISLGLGCLIALVVSWTIAQAYLSLGSIYHPDVDSLLRIAALLAGAITVGVAGAWLTGAPRRHLR